MIFRRFLPRAHPMQPHIYGLAIAGVMIFNLIAIAPATADIVPREVDVGDVRLGQRIWVDDGSCPSGQIKEITGTRLTPAGVERSRQCVERKNARH